MSSNFIGTQSYSSACTNSMFSADTDNTMAMEEISNVRCRFLPVDSGREKNVMKRKENVRKPIKPYALKVDEYGQLEYRYLDGVDSPNREHVVPSSLQTMQQQQQREDSVESSSNYSESNEDDTSTKTLSNNYEYIKPNQTFLPNFCNNEEMRDRKIANRLTTRNAIKKRRRKLGRHICIPKLKCIIIEIAKQIVNKAVSDLVQTFNLYGYLNQTASSMNPINCYANTQPLLQQMSLMPFPPSYQRTEQEDNFNMHGEAPSDVKASYYFGLLKNICGILIYFGISLFFFLFIFDVENFRAILTDSIIHLLVQFKVIKIQPKPVEQKTAEQILNKFRDIVANILSFY